MKSWKPVRVSATVGERRDGYISVDLENPTSGIALMVRLKLVDLTTGQLLAPVVYSDNYFSLVPQESKRIELHVIILEIEKFL